MEIEGFEPSASSKIDELQIAKAALDTVPSSSCRRSKHLRLATHISPLLVGMAHPPAAAAQGRPSPPPGAGKLLCASLACASLLSALVYLVCIRTDYTSKRTAKRLRRLLVKDPRTTLSRHLPTNIFRPNVLDDNDEVPCSLSAALALHADPLAATSQQCLGFCVHV